MSKNSGQFKPGHRKPGPGRPPASELEKLAKEEGKQALFSAYLYTKDMTVPELQKVMKSKDDPAIDEPAIVVLMASNILHGIKTGDWSKYDKQLDRVLGKVPQKNEVTGEGGAPMQVIISKDMEGF